MRVAARVGVVAAGYVAAVAVAWVGVTLYIAATSSIDRQTYSGMTAFGDSMVFLAVFGVVSLAPTSTALFFLRPYPRFWSVLSRTAVLVAITALAALLDYVLARWSGVGFLAGVWSAVAMLRILIAPLFALAWLAAAVVAPGRGARLALVTATAIECAVFATIVLVWVGDVR